VAHPKAVEEAKKERGRMEESRESIG